MKFILSLLSVALLLGCESSNEHFCAKYSYYYNELTQPGLLPRKDIREQLDADLKKKDSDKTRMMLFVLDEIDDHVKPDRETAQDYCLRARRWEVFKQRRGYKIK